LSSILLSILPVVAVLAIMSLYFGLRTGIFESGITYLAIKNTKLSRATFDEAIALGIGFGGIEAILLGANSLYSTFMLVQPYEILGLVPFFSFDPEALLAIPLPVAERAFILVCHVFATALVVYAVKRTDPRWLYVSIIYKTVIDGAILPLNFYLGDMGLYGHWLVELFFGALAIIGLIGLYWMKKRYAGDPLEANSAKNPGIPH